MEIQVSLGRAIQPASPRPRRPADVARNDDEAMHDSRGGDQPVDGWQRIWYGQPSPRLGNALVHRKYARSEPRPHLVEPRVQRGGLDGVGASLELYSATDLADHQNARMQVGRVDRGRPTHNTRMATLALAQLGDYVGVDQIGQSSTSRGVSPRWLWSNTPTKQSSGRSEPKISNTEATRGLATTERS